MPKIVFQVMCPAFHNSWDQAQEVMAYDAEQAAETFAEYDDQEGDYSFLNSRDGIGVQVRDPDGNIRRFRVHGESKPVYRAYEKE